MLVNNEPDLWHEFIHGEDDPSPGGGILYCLRYTRERLEAHREPVINALKQLGITLVDTGEDSVGARGGLLDESTTQSALLLFEELSVLNNALGYHDIGFGNLTSIAELRGRLVFQVEQCLAQDKRNYAVAYEIVTVIIPEIVRNIRLAHEQNNILSSTDVRELQLLKGYAKRRADLLDAPTGKVIVQA